MGKNKEDKKKKAEEIKEESGEQQTANETEERKAAEPDEAEVKEGSEEAVGNGDKSEGESEQTEEKKDPKDEKIAELAGRLDEEKKRHLAEFENFRKRSAEDLSRRYSDGEKAVVEAILPVIDNFERAFDMAGSDESKKDDPFIDGMEKVYKQLMDELEKLGVKPIAALGEDFDPNLHNAVMQEESDEYESGKVCKELQKGYLLNDSVVRHSMVSVAQ